MTKAVAEIGHNQPPLEDRIYADPDTDDAAVLKIVLSRIVSASADDVARATDRAAALASNAKRMPSSLDDTTMPAALDLLADIGFHLDNVEEIKARVQGAVKIVSDELAAICKPLDAGLSALDKKMRPLLLERLVARLDEHNGSLANHEDPATSITERGPSGSKATVTDGWSNSIVDPTAIPRDLCVPDQKAIDKAIADGREIPGVRRERNPSLRVTK